MKKSRVEVYLPETYNKKIMVKNNYGDIKIDNFKEATMEIEEDCGEVSVVSGKNIVVKNNYGDIKIGEAKFANIKESCGNIDIGKTNQIYIDAKTDLGQVEIGRNWRTAQTILTIKNNCGDIEVENN